jgi:hypothetical protein
MESSDEVTLKLKTEKDGVAELKARINLDLGKKFFDGIGAIVAANIIDNIESGRRADGGAIKSNRPSTVARKSRQGTTPNTPLIDTERRFVRRGKSSWSWSPRKDSVTIRPTSVGMSAPLDDLVDDVQRRGYVGWFGISSRGRRAITALLREHVSRILKGK